MFSVTQNFWNDVFLKRKRVEPGWRSLLVDVVSVGLELWDCGALNR